MNSISIKLTCNKDRHKISDIFELWPDLISHFGVTCHCNCSSGERALPSWATCSNFGVSNLIIYLVCPNFFGFLRFLFAGSGEPDSVHVVIDRHVITGQNVQSTIMAVQNLILMCSQK